MKSFGWSYKDYLRVLTDKSKNPIGLKIFFAILFAALVALGSATSLYYFHQKLAAPQKVRQAYLDSTTKDLNQTKESFEEVLALLKVSGAKVEAIDSLKKSSKSAAGFYASLDDYQKMLATLEALKKEIELQRDTQNKTDSPAEYKDIKEETLSFYDDAQNIISQQSSKYSFAKELLLALGPDLYSQSLTQASLWRENNQEEITTYYKKIKEAADNSLAILTKLSVGQEHRLLLSLEIEYLERIVNLSNNIVNTLSQENNQVGDQATNIEAAYQMLVGAQRENDQAYEKLKMEKDKIFNAGQNLSQLAEFVDREDSIVGKFENLKKSNDQKPSFILPLLKNI